MIVYVGQCGEVYCGLSYPEHHGKECCLPEGHHSHGIKEHMAFVWLKRQPDHLRFLTLQQKARHERMPSFLEIPTYMHYVVRPNLFSVGTVEGCY